MIVLLSWLIPGGGHFLLKKHYRAGLIAASVLILFILGLLMRGYMFDPQTGDVLTIQSSTWAALSRIWHREFVYPDQAVRLRRAM